MSAAPSTTALLAEQDDGGGFACTVTHRDGRVDIDRNGFTTALVLRELAGRPPDPMLDGIRARALTLLERCADPRMPGAYGFWPPGERPAWGRSVPPDCDDTAVLMLELLRAGLRSHEEARDTVYEVLVGSLCTDVTAPGPRWRRPLTFTTWLDPAFERRANAIDCAVNANVLALMATVGLTELPGYAESAAMIDAAVGEALGAEGRERRLRLWSVAPYYPDPRVFAVILEHAVACGVEELRRASEHLGKALPSVVVPSGDHALCGNAYGGPSWRCPAFEIARAGAPARSTALTG